jgi:hypothetical protein
MEEAYSVIGTRGKANPILNFPVRNYYPFSILKCPPAALTVAGRPKPFAWSFHRLPVLGSLDQTFCWGGEAEVSVSNYYLSEIRP